MMRMNEPGDIIRIRIYLLMAERRAHQATSLMNDSLLLLLRASYQLDTPTDRQASHRHGNGIDLFIVCDISTMNNRRQMAKQKRNSACLHVFIMDSIHQQRSSGGALSNVKTRDGRTDGESKRCRE
jgi:hypothetical protein